MVNVRYFFVVYLIHWFMMYGRFGSFSFKVLCFFHDFLVKDFIMIIYSLIIVDSRIRIKKVIIIIYLIMGEIIICQKFVESVGKKTQMMLNFARNAELI